MRLNKGKLIIKTMALAMLFIVQIQIANSALITSTFDYYGVLTGSTNPLAAVGSTFHATYQITFDSSLTFTIPGLREDVLTNQIQAGRYTVQNTTSGVLWRDVVITNAHAYWVYMMIFNNNTHSNLSYIPNEMMSYIEYTGGQSQAYWYDYNSRPENFDISLTAVVPRQAVPGNIDSVHGIESYFYDYDPASGITEGRITEYARNANNVPEPASIALIASGLLGFGVSRKRKHQA